MYVELPDEIVARLKSVAEYRHVSVRELFEQSARQLLMLIEEPGLDTIKIVTPGGVRREIRARVLLGTQHSLAVHRTIPHPEEVGQLEPLPWSLTHVHSGKRVLLFDSEAHAEDFGQRLWGGLNHSGQVLWGADDFTIQDQTLAAVIPPEILQEIHERTRAGQCVPWGGDDAVQIYRTLQPESDGDSSG